VSLCHAHEPDAHEPDAPGAMCHAINVRAQYDCCYTSRE
jgi:hypothetical protein